MILEEIINRDEKLPVTTEESLFVIKSYVKDRKNIDIDPVIISMHSLYAIRELQKMGMLYLHALMWYKSNTNN